MASTRSAPPSSETPASTDPSSLEQVGAQPTQVEPTLDIRAFRETDQGRELAAWLKSEFDSAKTARKPIEAQWYVNLAMTRGDQWTKAVPNSATGVGDFDYKFLRSPDRNSERRTVNRLRAFTRWECSKFTSRQPSIVSVPGTGEDQDVFASYAAEQVWESVSTAKQLRRHFAYASWWAAHTGNGFIKTEYDRFSRTQDGILGDIKYSNITPFNLFVPDLREPEIQNQPFIILAYTKSKTWAQSVWSEELKGAKLTGRDDGGATLIDDAYLRLQKSRKQDCVIVYEMWIKPGAHHAFPNGGLLLMVEDVLVGAWVDTFPYSHGKFPVSHFRHLQTGGFYADSPLNDLNQLQREYNQLRTRISESAKLMANLQLMAPKGSVIPSKITTQIGQLVEFRPGMGAPQPLPLQGLPAYVMQQQDRILADFEDISGIRDVTTGQAPAGVTAGTALSYLQEAANSFHTPQFQDIEFMHEDIAQQTLALFNQYVDFPRKIKTIGADQAFGTLLLSGSDVSNGLDIRVEANSAAPQSQAAVRAMVFDMVSIGLIDRQMALKMLDVNGFQRMQDIAKVAERKAQRENMKMKLLSPLDVENATMQAQMEQQAQGRAFLAANPEAAADPQVLAELQQPAQPPLLIPVADFDDHETHILIHNAFCMGQEYETLDPSVQQQIRMHVMVHQQYLQAQQLQTFMSAMPSDGSDAPGAGPADQDAASEGSEPAPDAEGPGTLRWPRPPQEDSEMAQGDHYNDKVPALPFKGGAGTPTIAALRSALSTYNSTSYTSARLDAMTKRDLVYAVRLHGLTVVGL